MTVKTALYRHWNSEGKLLYVGISLRPFERLAAHVFGSHWADTIDKVTMEYFDTRLDADAAERRAIKEERPAFNIVHAVSGDRMVATEARPKETRDSIPQWAADAHVYKHATERGQRGTDPEMAIESACAESLRVSGRPTVYRMTPERAETSIDRMVADGRLVRSLGGLFPPISNDYVHVLAIPRYLAESALLEDAAA